MEKEVSEEGGWRKKWTDEGALKMEKEGSG